MGRTLYNFSTNFTSGELDARLAARSDTRFYFNGCERLRDFVVLPQGGVRRRPGMRYVDTLTSSELSRIDGGATGVFSTTLGNDSGGWVNYHYRQLFAPSLLTRNGNTVQVKFEAAAGEGFKVDDVYIGHAASSGNAWDFDGNQVRVTFSAGSHGFDIAGGATITSDAITFTLDKTRTLIVAVDVSTDAAKDGTKGLNPLSGASNYAKAATNGASSTTVSGMTLQPKPLYSISAITATSTNEPVYTATNGGTAANATDQDTSTVVLSTNNVTTTNPYVLLHVDMQTARSIVAVAIQDLLITSGDTSGIYIQYSTDNVTFSNYGNPLLNVGTTGRNYMRTQAVSARYWRVAKTDGIDGGTAKLSMSGIDFYVAGDSAYAAKLIPFELDIDTAYLHVLTDRLVTIYHEDTEYAAMPGPYTAAQLPKVNWAQDSSTLITVHKEVYPQSISVNDTDDTDWTISNVTFDYIPKYNFDITSTQPAATLTPSATLGNITFTAGAAVFSSGYVGDIIDGNGGLARLTQYNSTTVMVGVSLVPFYGTGAIASGSWTIRGDFVNAWSSTYGYPQAITFHEGRMYLAGSTYRPHTVWGSRIDDYYNFNPNQGLDDDALEFTLDTNQLNEIVNLYSGQDLQLFTSGGEFYAPQTFNEPITPTNINIKRQTARGSKAGVRVMEVDSGTMFVERNGKNVREFLYQDSQQKYTADTISILSAHLISDPVAQTIKPAQAADEADLLLEVNDDGTLAMCSTLRSQEITAWTLATTYGESDVQATILDTVALAQSTGDTYIVVKRQINAANVMTLEKFDNDYLLDCSRKVAVSASSTATGFTHLASSTVDVIHYDSDDNATYLGAKAVDGSGNISLGASYTGTIEAGYGFTCYGKTMPVDPQLPEGTARGRKKRVVEATFLLKETGDLTVNGDTISFGGDSSFDGSKTFEAIGDYDEEGQIEFGQDSPLPLTILGIVAQVSI